MVHVHVVRVFTDSHGRHGNPLGVVTDAAAVPDSARRQALATQLGYSETVFVEHADKAEIVVYGPNKPVRFAGHAAVGAAWLLARRAGRHPEKLRTPAGDVTTWTKSDGTVWVRAPLAITPPWWHERLPAPADLEALTGPLRPSQDMTQIYAWEDEAAGVVRVRTFASRSGVPEDEACGSGAMRMAAALGRRLIFHHGQGSVIHAKPGLPGHVDLGGQVTQDEPRTL